LDLMIHCLKKGKFWTQIFFPLYFNVFFCQRKFGDGSHERKFK
jgi:hypothetical protein